MSYYNAIYGALFGFHGRIGRLRYVGRLLIVSIASLILMLAGFKIWSAADSLTITAIVALFAPVAIAAT